MKNVELEMKLNQLTDIVAKLVSSLPLKNGENIKIEAPVISTENKIERMLGGPSDPIPQDYRDTVDSLLNNKFGVHVKANTGLPQFKFTIIVPKEYSPESGFDVRPLVIDYALGLNGVKDWCARVLNTFDQQTKNTIIADRTVVA